MALGYKVVLLLWLFLVTLCSKLCSLLKMVIFVFVV